MSYKKHKPDKNLFKKTFIVFSSFFATFLSKANSALAQVSISDGKIGNITDKKSVTAGTVDITSLASKIFGQFGLYLNGAIGIALITVALGFVIRCAQLAMHGDNARKRGASIEAMLWTIVAIGGIGAFSTVMTLLVGFSKGV